MVLRLRKNKMSSEQPQKKKLKITDETNQPSDEPDYIQADLQGLHLSFNEAARNAVNSQFHGEKPVFRTSESESEKSEKASVYGSESAKSSESIVNEVISESSVQNGEFDFVENDQNWSTNVILDRNFVDVDQADLDEFQRHLVKQCLCGLSEQVLRKPFEGEQISDSTGLRPAMLSEWTTKKVLQFLSNLQLLFDVHSKQYSKGYTCSRIVDICNTIIRNEDNLIEQIISLCDTRNKYVNFLAAKVLSSFLITAKTNANINNEWLENIMNFLSMENIDYVKMNFALEIVKYVVEWKDIELPTASESDARAIASTSFQVESNEDCEKENCDPENYDTSAIKGLIIKSLETKWPELIPKIQHLIIHNNSVSAQTCILTFLALWESTISVKANLSVSDTKPFYAHLEGFVKLLITRQLSPIIWKQLVSLFNEVLCYGSTLALQDMLPDDTCQLALLIVRNVKDYRLLDSLPFRSDEGFTVHRFVGTIVSTQVGRSSIDKTLLQKMVLLVLKSVAITIKETRSDSSDSSIGSDDSDFYQDMQHIERSIRDVLKKVEVFVKNSLDFHPETPFSKILVHLFSDQDDYMIESMVCTLDVTVGISYRNALFPDLINMLNPIHSFIEFLNIVGHQSDALLDFLVNNETCFLLYLLRFLKYTKRNWSKFVSSCGEGSASRSNELDDTMSVLIRLKMQISRLVYRELFPYNISPVLRLLKACEDLYEGNEFS